MRKPVYLHLNPVTNNDVAVCCTVVLLYSLNTVLGFGACCFPNLTSGHFLQQFSLCSSYEHFWTGHHHMTTLKINHHLLAKTVAKKHKNNFAYVQCIVWEKQNCKYC